MADEMTQAEVDALVYEKLTGDYVDFGDVKVGLPFTQENIRASLLRLQADGKAELAYGRGWKALVKVVGNESE